MELLEHFEEEKKQFLILTLKDEEWETFSKKLPSQFKPCYISDNDLSKRIINFSSSKENEFSEILPSKGNIKSGDFGEIFSYLIFKERHSQKIVDGPRKWRWKQEKDVAAPYSDVILFSIQDTKPSKEDLIISVESKMKATTSKTYDPIQNAIIGAEKDYVTRIASSLNWLRKKYKDESLKENASIDKYVKLVEVVERFIKSETTGEYTKEIKAIAIVDKNFVSEEVNKTVTLPTDANIDIEIIVVAVKNLQELYEKGIFGNS